MCVWQTTLKWNFCEIKIKFKYVERSNNNNNEEIIII